MREFQRKEYCVVLIRSSILLCCSAFHIRLFTNLNEDIENGSKRHHSIINMAPMAEVMYVLKQGIEIDFNIHTKVKRIA